jgi:hypothetical protein
VPDWAVTLLQMIQMQRDDILRETEELKLATTLKVAEFRDIRGLKEAENQRLQQGEAIRVNNGLFALIPILSLSFETHLFVQRSFESATKWETEHLTSRGTRRTRWLKWLEWMLR